jgi:hypothetical protein
MMKNYKTLNLPNMCRFKEDNTQLLYEYFNGINVIIIKKWKVGIRCNIITVRYILYSLPKDIDEVELFNCLDVLEYEDNLI